MPQRRVLRSALGPRTKKLWRRVAPSQRPERRRRPGRNPPLRTSRMLMPSAQVCLPCGDTIPLSCMVVVHVTKPLSSIWVLAALGPGFVCFWTTHL
jgi:hypothetical protein